MEVGNLDTVSTPEPNIPRMKIAILAESGELGVPHPCEGCTLRMKTAILAESGDARLHDPCEGCILRMKSEF